MKKDFTKNSKLGKLNSASEAGHELATNQKSKTLAVKISSKVIDTLNDYVFWTPNNQSEVVEQILSDFLDKQDIQPIPQHIKDQQERAKQKRQAGMKK
ncbi:hypothetical protein [Tunicatimonas pelagia]|uniref:hypothetical protein n=1 Tax=Tunicatimonas pelagia TaxID=931531 RepID=UPI0026650B54|nr:hypothetical protein [Tunicatimonas pelagia]WKN46518.1 hypothetical protein P0M28_30885 [Tunicatimonas pelagia]